MSDISCWISLKRRKTRRRRRRIKIKIKSIGRYIIDEAIIFQCEKKKIPMRFNFSLNVAIKTICLTRINCMGYVT